MESFRLDGHTAVIMINVKRDDLHGIRARVAEYIANARSEREAMWASALVSLAPMRRLTFPDQQQTQQAVYKTNVTGALKERNRLPAGRETLSSVWQQAGNIVQ
jgi:hypothetical protein